MGIFGNWFSSGKSFYESKGFYFNEHIGNNEPIYVDMHNLSNVYHEITHVKTVINKDAEMTSNFTWQLFDKNNELIENDPILDLLKAPNPLQTGGDFIFSLIVNENIYGNAFIFMNRALDSSLPKTLWVLPSKDMVIKPTGKVFRQVDIDGIIESYILDSDNQKEKFEPNEIIHFKQNDDRVILAESKLKTLKQQISNLKGAYDSRNVLINERGAIGLLSYKGGDDMIGLSPDDKKLAEEKLVNSYGIKKGQRRINISTIPVDYKPMSFKTKDLLLFEEVADDFNAILDAYNQNINIYSTDDGTTFTNYRDTLKGIYQNAIIPKANRLADMLTTKLINDNSGKYLKPFFDVDVLKEGEKEKSEAFKIKTDALTGLIDSGVLTPVEVKELLEKNLSNENV